MPRSSRYTPPWWGPWAARTLARVAALLVAAAGLLVVPSTTAVAGGPALSIECGFTFKGIFNTYRAVVEADVIASATGATPLTTTVHCRVYTSDFAEHLRVGGTTAGGEARGANARIMSLDAYQTCWEGRVDWLDAPPTIVPWTCPHHPYSLDPPF